MQKRPWLITPASVPRFIPLAWRVLIRKKHKVFFLMRELGWQTTPATVVLRPGLG